MQQHRPPEASPASMRMLPATIPAIPRP
jgi:hypothetical protein